MAWKIHKKHIDRKKLGRRNARNCTLFFDRGEVDPFSVIPEEHKYVRGKRFLHEHNYKYFNEITEDEFWILEEQAREERQTYYERNIDLTQYSHGRSLKGLKNSLSRARRRRNKKACNAYLMEDYERGERERSEWHHEEFAWQVW